MRYSSLAVARAASTNPWRRHLPPSLILLACFIALFATSRPTARLNMPWSISTVMLAIHRPSEPR